MDGNEYLRFQVNREVKTLYKSLLETLEFLQNKGYNFGEDYQWIRKRVLDKSNDTIRSLEDEISKLDISFKSNKKD